MFVFCCFASVVVCLSPAEGSRHFWWLPSGGFVQGTTGVADQAKAKGGDGSDSDDGASSPQHLQAVMLRTPRQLPMKADGLMNWRKNFKCWKS